MLQSLTRYAIFTLRKKINPLFRRVTWQKLFLVRIQIYVDLHFHIHKVNPTRISIDEKIER